MKRLFTLAAVVSLAALTSCFKGGEIDYIMSGYSMYTTGASFNYLTTDPANIALRLNALLAEANDAEDLNAFTSENKTKLFGNATFTRTGNDILISYPKNHFGAKEDEKRTGEVIVHTGGTRLNAPDAVWTVSLPTGDPEKNIRLITDVTVFYHECTSYELKRVDKDIVVTFSGFMSYYKNDRDNAAKWSGTFTLTPNNIDEMDYDGLMLQPRTLKACETSGSSIGNTETIAYKVLSPIKYDPAGGNWHFITEGKEYVSYPYLKQLDPETFPASDVIAETEGVVSLRSWAMEITYNGESRVLR